MYHLLHDIQTSWWVEVGDVGLIYFTGVLPGQNANINVLFWDGKLTETRRVVTACVLATAFDLFQLPRITAFVHEKNAHQKIFFRKIGFVLEGVMRCGARSATGFEDLIMFSMLQEEIPPVPRMKVDVHGSAV